MTVLNSLEYCVIQILSCILMYSIFCHSVLCQRMYMLKMLKSADKLHIVAHSLIMSRVLSGLSSLGDFLSAELVARVDALLRRLWLLSA